MTKEQKKKSEGIPLSCFTFLSFHQKFWFLSYHELFTLFLSLNRRIFPLNSQINFHTKKSKIKFSRKTSNFYGSIFSLNNKKKKRKSSIIIFPSFKSFTIIIQLVIIKTSSFLFFHSIRYYIHNIMRFVGGDWWIQG